MKVVYNDKFNIDLGLLNYLHPFDGTKFRKIHAALKNTPNVEFMSPQASMSMEIIDSFLTRVMQHRVRNKNGIFKALEVPRLPFVSFNYLDKKILEPMRWGVAGTLFAAENALIDKQIYWNLSGGYHHAMQQNMEGFCIYNDIGITCQQLLERGKLSEDDKLIIIDTDAHHGNGNAYTFMDIANVTLMDIYNAGIYPTSSYTRERVDISIPLKPGTDGETYLRALKGGLEQIESGYKLAFVVAGTDTLQSDKLGGLYLSIDEVAHREKMILDALKNLDIPTVVLGGGGYSKESAMAVIKSIKQNLDSK